MKYNTKNDLRKIILKKRSSFSKEFVKTKSAIISKLLLKELNKYTQTKNNFHIYLPIIDSNEIDISKAINFLANNNKNVFYSPPPKAYLKPKSFNKLINWENNKPNLDIVIVPMLGYDPYDNHRIGYGKGYYDRLLSINKNVVSIGVCYKDFEYSFMKNEYDISLTKIISC